MQDMGTSLLRAPKLVLSEAERARLDEAPDTVFYATPRTMQHAEPQLIDALTRLYASLLPAGGSVLELCASRHSHLPGGLGLSRVVGQGMNEEELPGNPALSQWWCQDLNAQPLLLEQVDASYDAVLFVNGLQYLTQPELVLTEAWRVLRPGGLLLVAFGDACFPEKVTAGWSTRNMEQRASLVATMLQTNGFEQVRVLDSISAAHAAAAAAAAPANAQHAGSTASGSQRPVATSSQCAAGVAGPAAGQPAAAASEVQIRILVASKGWGSGSTLSSSTPQPAAAASAMRADNVAQWFTTPGLAGLADVAVVGGAAGAAEQTPASNPSAAASSDSEQHLQQQQELDVSAAFSDERLLQQWVASYEVLVGDAAELGIPRSVIPQLGPQPSPGEVQAAVAHLQAMVASFLSAGL